MELEWLKKKLPSSIEVKRTMIETDHPTLSIRRQCKLISLNRATFYWQPAGESPLNLELMRLIDEEYTRAPFYGYRKMTVRLNHQHGYQVNHKRVARLMQKMGLQAVYPRPRTSNNSTPDKQPRKYPYLLRGLDIKRPNQVWAADITYVPMPVGFIYLVPIMDWFSRFVVAWQLSNTLDGAFCLDALRLALRHGQPEIFNTDQGVQFTAHDFTGELEAANIRISMDGRGRVFDNIFVERLWRTVKYEDIYIKDYATVPALAAGLNIFFNLYNYERPHQSLGYATPADVHFAVKVPIL
jgi:putative transposase